MKGYRNSVLREMGLTPVWRLRSESAPTIAAQAESLLHVTSNSEQSAAVAASVTDDGKQAFAEGVAHSRHTRLDGVIESGAKTQGRAAVAETADRRDAARCSVDEAASREQLIASLDWEALEDDIRSCTACRLCEQRNKTVAGSGDRDADWMVVGEGPGAEEDRTGEPFVGAAGKLLDAMLAAIGLKRGEKVFIANAVKCRPPMNRTPEADEIAACRPYLERQIELVKPRLVLAMGRPAATSLIGHEVKINAARGRMHQRGAQGLLVTYHPAYLLRNPADKRRAWEDLCLARAHMQKLSEPSER